MKIRTAYWAVLVFILAGCSLQAGSLVLGNPPKTATGNCDPFGCPAFFGLGTYQQVYLGSAFPSEISIAGLTFFQGQVQNGGQLGGGTYSLSFSYTPFNPGGLNLNDPNNNIGADSQSFFTGTLPPLTPEGTGSFLVITGAPFDYNPADGNLLLTVTVSGATTSSPVLFLNQSQCGPKTFCPAGASVVSSDAYFGVINGTPISGGNDTGGLVTGFDYSNPTTTPEPASLLLVLSGVGFFGYRRRKRAA
jgi:PEP-CTERM motif